MNYVELYVDFLKKYIQLKKPMRVVCDCSNGTAGLIIEKFTAIPHLEIIVINEQPDPEFPAHGPNPLEPGATAQLSQKVIETGAHFGVAFDADADRIFFVDEQGLLLSSHIIALVMFMNHPPPYVGDELVYQTLKHMRSSDRDLIASKVGSYFVKQELQKVRGSLAVEFSGHYYFKDFFNADSGIFAMIQVANVLSGLEASLSAFWKSLPPHILHNENIPTKGRTWDDIKFLIQKRFEGDELSYRDGITVDRGHSWVNIRPSNTEPLVRIIAGSSTLAESKALAGEVKILF